VLQAVLQAVQAVLQAVLQAVQAVQAVLQAVVQAVLQAVVQAVLQVVLQVVVQAVLQAVVQAVLQAVQPVPVLPQWLMLLMSTSPVRQHFPPPARLVFITSSLQLATATASATSVLGHEWWNVVVIVTT
jgi:hypothetical protein